MPSITSSLPKSAAVALALAHVAVAARAGDPPPPANPPAEGLLLWLDASDKATTSVDAQGSLTRWTDRSGHGVEFKSEHPDNAPRLVPSALYWRAALRFNGQQSLASSKPVRTDAGPVSVFVVARETPSPDPTAPPPVEPLLALAAAPGGPGEFGLTTATDIIKRGETKVYSADADSAPAGLAVIGKAIAAGGFFHGEIGEVLIYDHPFANAGARKVLTDYLWTKWQASPPPNPGEWTRKGDLGTVPARTRDDLPLSDQANTGRWVPDPRFSDDFNGDGPDLGRWHVNPTEPGDWPGRQPALYSPANIEVREGKLRLTARKGDVPEMAKYPGQGYAGYTTASIETKERSGYGYYEIKAKPMNSAFSSAFWLTNTGLPENGTEIDVFEIGGKAPGHENEYHMHVHIFSTPGHKDEHWSVGSAWRAPWKFVEDYHIFGLEWNQEQIVWYVDGAPVYKVRNTNWFFPMRIVLDSEAMWQWFGKVNDNDLPSTFEVEYLRVWRHEK